VLTAGEVLQTDPREGETLWNGIERLKAAHGFRNTAREIPFSSAVKRVLQFGADEADALRHTDIRPPHLLLGLLREEGAEAWRTLTEAGVRLADVRRSVGAQE
jgi:ATP-dependent Clp protease ATP-binding subunit ClpA